MLLISLKFANFSPDTRSIFSHSGFRSIVLAKLYHPFVAARPCGRCARARIFLPQASLHYTMNCSAFHFRVHFVI